MEAGDLVRRSARWLERRTEALRAAGGVVGTVGYEEVLERLKRALPERGVVVRHDATGVLVEWESPGRLLRAGVYRVGDLEALDPMEETTRQELGVLP